MAFEKKVKFVSMQQQINHSLCVFYFLLAVGVSLVMMMRHVYHTFHAVKQTAVRIACFCLVVIDMLTTPFPQLNKLLSELLSFCQLAMQEMVKG